MAAACAAELLVTLLNHPLRYSAPHEAPGEGGPLGPTFHTLRTSLQTHAVMIAEQPGDAACSCCGIATQAALACGGLQWLAAWLREGGALPGRGGSSGGDGGGVCGSSGSGSEAVTAW